MPTKAQRLSGMSASSAIARWTILRHLRSRTVWIAAILAALPLLPLLGSSLAAAGNPWREFYSLVRPLLAILPPLFMGAAVAEEVESGTLSYLWPRPMPRWSLLLGKVMAGVPLAAGLLMLVLAAGFAVLGRGSPELLARGLVSVLVGCTAIGLVAATLGTLIPKQALAVSIGYFLVLDLPLAAIPMSISNLSMAKHTSVIAGVLPGSAPTAAVWLATMTAIWVLVARWRIGRAEFGRLE